MNMKKQRSTARYNMRRNESTDVTILYNPKKHNIEWVFSPRNHTIIS